METIYKTYRADVKGVDSETGEVDMYIPVSANSVDRDGEVVEPTAFKKTLPRFMKRPLLMSSHNYRDLTSQIGEWKRLKITTEGMEGKPQYYINEGNEEADWGFKLASKGMAAFSIGFIPKKWEDGDGEKTPRRTYQEVELLEISHVTIPSNRDAIQGLRSKSADPVVLELLDEVEDSELIEDEYIGVAQKHSDGDVIIEIPPTPAIIIPKDLITKPEETSDYIRIPVDTGNHGDHRIRTIDISASQGIKALYCGTCKKVITYLFAKEKGWTMEKARAWVKEHEKTASQDAIRDELDYLDILIEDNGLNDENKDLLEMIYRRVTGNDIPEDITSDGEDLGLAISEAIKDLARK